MTRNRRTRHVAPQAAPAAAARPVLGVGRHAGHGRCPRCGHTLALCVCEPPPVTPATRDPKIVDTRNITKQKRKK
jgi:DTW domain-containing protein YfiP